METLVLFAASVEMRRVLEDAVTALGPPGQKGLELFRWRHGALHDATQAMEQHVLMAYRDTPRIIRRRQGLRLVTSTTDNHSVTIIPAGLAAEWDIDGGLDVVHLYISQERLAATASSADLSTDLSVRDAVAAPDPVLSHLIRQLGATGTRNDPSCIDSLYSDTLAEAICLHLLRSWSASRGLPDPTRSYALAPTNLRRAMTFMLDNMQYAPSLATIAAEIGLSPKHFCTAFRRETGLPPHAWLREQRMAEAKRRMLDPRCSLAEVAVDLGYSDQSAFGTAFKRYSGMPPAAWRRRLA